MYKGEPWIIDFPQAIDFSSRPGRHRVLKKGIPILRRDIRNIVKYFQQYGINGDPESLCDECTDQVGLHDRFDKTMLRR